MGRKLKVKKGDDSRSKGTTHLEENPPKYQPTEVYVRLINGQNLPTDKSGKNMFFCVFYVHDGTSKFRINKSTTKSYLQTPEVQSRNGNPKWDCFEEFPVKTERDYLTIKIFRDRTKLGRINIPAWEIPEEKGQVFTLQLQNKPKRALAPSFRDAKEGSIQLEAYVTKHVEFELPPPGPKREKFVREYFKAIDKMKDIQFLNTGKSETAAADMLNDDADSNEPAIVHFLPTTSPTASRTKVHIRGRGLGKSKKDIKSIHICGLDVTATLEHLNSTSLKVTTSFWKESVGKIMIAMKDGTVIESTSDFEFSNDANGLNPFGARPSQSSMYTEFIPRSGASFAGQDRSPSVSTQQNRSDNLNYENQDQVRYMGDIDFPYYEKMAEKGSDEDVRVSLRRLLKETRGQQEHLYESMRHREKLMLVILEEAPHLMAKTQDVKKKRKPSHSGKHKSNRE